MNRRTILRLLPLAGFVLLAAALVAIPLWLDRSHVRELGENWRLHWPWALLGLLVPAAILALGLWTRRRQTTRWRFPLALLAAEGPVSWRVRLRHAPVVLRAAGLGLCIVALARPQGSHELWETSSEGIDIVLALDMSGSMQEPDMFPNRFSVEKDVVRSFIGQRKNDRIGVVVFGSEAYPLCPLTSDHTLLDQMLADLELEHMPETMQNTAIGDALASALARLDKSDAASRVIVLVTDGMDNESDIDPLDAAAEAKTQGVRVYTVLLGVQGQVLVPQAVDLLGNPIRLGAPQQFPTDPQLLKDIAKKTDGAFFEAAQRKELEKAFHDILNALKKTERSSRVELANERFEFFLWLAAAVFGLEFLLRHLWLRELA
ncbi:MAG: VWA domain-containing protein [Deltaproteobacteria bacterium]|nr:VWA domain-containing protein [Deltaproteobacteria bacterium]